MFRFFLYIIGQRIVNFLPLSAAYAFAQVISDLQYAVSTTDRRSVRSNMKKIFKSENIDERHVKDVFRFFGRYLVDFFRMVRDVDESFIQKNVKCEGVENLKEVLGRGKGAIIITAHIGNWELGGIIMSKMGFPIHAVALPHKHKLVNDFFNSQRKKCGVSVVPPNQAFRRFLEKLKENESVALVADRDFGINGIIMNFFGCPTLLPKGPAVLSIKTGAGIVPTFFMFNPDGTYSLTFNKPVYPSYVDDQTLSEDVLKEMINKYITVIEEKIRQFPGQWLMFRKFWVNGSLLASPNDKSPKSTPQSVGKSIVGKGKVTL